MHLLTTMEQNDKFTNADMNNVSFVINPKGDLSKTASRFQGWFQSIQNWKGTCNKKPSSLEWVKYVEESDIFVYCGHGSGKQFYCKEEIIRSKSKALPFLMGCSSGLLKEDGISEPSSFFLLLLLLF